MLNPDQSPFAKDTTTNLAYIAHQVHPPMQREKQVNQVITLISNKKKHCN